MANYDDLIEAAGQQHNVDPGLIRAVIQTESSGNPRAVSSKGAVGLGQLMPATAKSLGVSDPTDPKQAIPAIAALLNENLNRYGNVQDALRAYHGGTDQKNWGPLTQAYPQKVLSNIGRGQPATAQTLPGIPQRSPGVDASSLSDDQILSAFPEAGQQQAKAQKPISQPAPNQRATPASLTDEQIMAAFPEAAGGTQAAPAQRPQQPQPAPIARPANQPAQQVDPLWRGLDLATKLGQGTVGLTDTFFGAPGALISQLEYAGRRAVGQSPQQAEEGAQHGVGAFLSHPVSDAANGLARLLGGNTDIRTTEGYQGEATQKGLALLGQKLGQGAAAVSRATGIPQQDVMNMAQTGMMAVPGLVKGAAPIAREAAMATALDDTAIRPPRPVGPPMQPRAMAGAGSASANPNPYPVLTGEEASRGVFPQVKTSKVAQDVTPQEQAVRARIVNEIMGDNAGQVRTGVITGNENLLRDEHTAAKSPQETPANQAMRQQLAMEQQALSDYAEKRIEATGANPRLINDEQRGQAINDAFHGEGGLSDYFKQAKDAIYEQAKAESGSNPIKTSNVDALLKDPQFLAEAKRNGHTGVVEGARELIDLARTTGFRDPITGEVTAPGSVAAWDAVRKSNNAGWTHENARTIGAINRAIDQDVAAAAGSDAYKLGDAIHKAQKTIMDTPAISKVFGDVDANGIKSGVPLEKLPAKLNNLPLDQWKHIYNTLDDLSRGQLRNAPEGMPPVPPELRQLAEAARNEMSGALARNIYERGAGKAGVWNQSEVNKALNSVIGQKILQTFPPDEIAAFHTLNYGGQIMPGVHSYEGAAQQAARLNKPGFVEKYGAKAGGVVGGAIGHAIPIPGAGVLGTLGGVQAGEGLSRLMENRRGGKQYNRVQKELRANSKMGLESLRHR
jgi:hypothetical protein